MQVIDSKFNLYEKTECDEESAGNNHRKIHVFFMKIETIGYSYLPNKY